MWHFSSCPWVLSLNWMSLRPTHIVAIEGTMYFFYGWIAAKTHIWFLSPFCDEHVGWSHIVVFVKAMAVSMRDTCSISFVYIHSRCSGSLCRVTPLLRYCHAITTVISISFTVGKQCFNCFLWLVVPAFLSVWSWGGGSLFDLAFPIKFCSYKVMNPTALMGRAGR